jgi:hypothetical protein
MLRFFSSLTFFYAFIILTLVIYGYWFYRSFAAGRFRRNRFPYVFALVALCSAGFLWINFHPPLNLRSFSNLDHYSLRHDGFLLKKEKGLPAGLNPRDYKIENLGTDSIFISKNYPVSYPLAEENRDDWSEHTVNKFLVSDHNDLLSLPPAFKEGFMFKPPGENDNLAFEPIFISYSRSSAEHRALPYESLVLESKDKSLAWKFSIVDSFNWKFESGSMSKSTWMWIIFGSLAFYFLIIFTCSIIIPANKLSWVWQLLSCIILVLLTTRYFLYWRYKSFPPYEGLDLPSVQQLETAWNFLVIPITGLAVSLIFGFPLFRHFSKKTDEQFSPEERLQTAVQKITIVQRLGFKTIFFFSWIAILLCSAAIGAFNDFEQSTCRHLAIGLVVAYFLFVYVSYRHSPLVKPANLSWWNLGTGRRLDFLVSNPVKVLLSVSLLAVYVFIDIGFAIVFINFLLFNEAFLCFNYAVAGLSAGSRKNARLFGFAGLVYLVLFILNLLYAPGILKAMLDLPATFYMLGYFLFAIILAYNFSRLIRVPVRRKWKTGAGITILVFTIAFLFFPKERIMDKAAMTRYRIDVMSMPVNEAIEGAYREGKTWEPVIRAAQNQWFINSFIHEENNPGVNKPGFTLLPHAPQNKGARYNAQATDLVTSRFLIAEHGRWSVLLYVLLLMLPVSLLASFYKLYPDFTNRINTNYPTITTGFSLLNYLLVTALLVILAATGKYIFFGQDLPFGSILSKQSILFPAAIILSVVMLFRFIPAERYPNKRKLFPGLIVFLVIGGVLFFVKPIYNTSKVFNVIDESGTNEEYIAQYIQPIFDHIDTSVQTQKLAVKEKDNLFTDSLKKLIARGVPAGAGNFLRSEITDYSNRSFDEHLSQRRLIYLNLHKSRPRVTINRNYFKVEAPPHLQQSWTGNIFGDSTNYNIGVWDVKNKINRNFHVNSNSGTREIELTGQFTFKFTDTGEGYLFYGNKRYKLCNPSTIELKDSMQNPYIISVEPDAFMRNLYVNGSRFYVYPMQNRFVWARHFAESIASDYITRESSKKNAVVSFDYVLMDSIYARINNTLSADTSYHRGAEYGITIADGNGRILALNDFIKGTDRPDPNDKAAFAALVSGENITISQSQLRKLVGNLNLLRLQPGPGSTFKPIVFASIASQMKMDWDKFSSEGFTGPQRVYGGEKVAEYDFEKNNGRISSVRDYIRVSDNYYHSNVLLLGSYTKERLDDMLVRYFINNNPDTGFHWPNFNYSGKAYFLDQFRNWPEFASDSSFVSLGLQNNFGIQTFSQDKSFDRFVSNYDSMLFSNAWRKSGFILPEYALFDQQGRNADHHVPYDIFSACFRGHVKGSSQVMVPPVKMLEAYGKLITQNRNYSLTLNPYAKEKIFFAFDIDQSIAYTDYLSLIRESVFGGMEDALYNGTAAALGAMLKGSSPYYYYAKTGTTGDNSLTTKSKLFTFIISQKDITNPGFSFRDNKFLVIYFTSQNGPAKQNEKFQAELIRMIENSAAVKRYFNAPPNV